MANTNPYTSTRICKDCGKVMTNVSNTKLYCPECAKKRHDEQTAAWWAKRNEQIRTPYQRRESPEARIRNAEKRDAEFRADCRAADAAGSRFTSLRFAAYAAESKQKARRCSNTDEP